MRITTRVAVATVTAACTVLPGVVSAFAADEATSFGATVCTAPTPPAGFTVKDLGNGHDELVLSPTNTTNYIIYGGSGNDDIVGGGGNDIICGGSGDDGLNGGPGDDLIVGGAGHDFLSGAPGNDSVNGGDGDDALYGGDGVDLMLGDAGTNYVRGGPPGVNLGDLDTVHPDNGVCPPSAAALVGVYRPARFDVVNPCQTLDGYIVEGSKADSEDNDGDQHFKVQQGGCFGKPLDKTFVIEFTPRDKQKFHFVRWNTTTCNNSITLVGAHVFDCNVHPCGAFRDGREIHPVYHVYNRGQFGLSGPQFGGSPWVLNPSADGKLPRFCWDELGAPCQPWNNVDPFS